MSLEDALDRLGVKGVFPLVIYVFSLYIGIGTPWILFVDSFAGYVPHHHCYVDHFNSSQLSKYYPPDKKSFDGYDECKKYNGTGNESTITDCSRYIYVFANGETEKISYVAEWNLVCDRLFWSKFTSTMFFVGNIIGNVVFSYASDKYGRLKVFLGTTWSVGVAGVLLAFSDSIGGLPTYIFLRTVLGAFSGAVYNVGFVYGNEMFSPKYRSYVGMISNIVWSAATAALPGVAYLIPDWKLFIIAVSLPNFLTIPWVLFFPESLPWLIRNGRSDEALAYLKRVAISRNIILPDDVLDVKDEDGNRKVEEPLKFAVLIRSPIIVRCILIGMGLFFVNSLVYYGLTMSSTDLSDDRYLNFFLSGLAEIPGYTLGMFATRYFGRRRPMMTFFTVTGVSLVAVAVINLVSSTPNLTLILILIFIGKFGTSGTYGIVVLFVIEIFPTNTRTVALGLCTVGARLGSIWSPYASILQEHSPAALQFIFGIGSLLCVVGTYFMPETNNQPLPNNIADLEELEAKTIRWRTRRVGEKSNLLESDQLGKKELGDTASRYPAGNGVASDAANLYPAGNGVDFDAAAERELHAY